jgi:hypothetical protein
MALLKLGCLSSPSHVCSGKKVPLPLKLFEVSDVVSLDREAEVDGTRVGAVNIRMMAAIIVDTKDGFEVIHGLVDRLMLLFGLSRDEYHTVTIAVHHLYLFGRQPCSLVIFNTLDNTLDKTEFVYGRAMLRKRLLRLTGTRLR